MSEGCTQLCRACLTAGEFYKYILGENVSIDMYLYCTTIEVIEDDLPKTLCDICYKNLVKYSEFKRICIQSQKTLSTKIKTNVASTLPESLDFTSLPLKTEDSSNEHDVFAVKEEGVTDNLSDDLYEPFGYSYALNKKKIKRKLKKLEKQKGKRKVKLKITRNHFNFTCELCNKKFNYLDRFEAHKLEHEGKEVPIHCAPCNKTFMTWSGLRRHNESDHTLVSLEKLRCSICGKICKSERSLKMHQNIHGERKLYFCDACGRGFTTKFILKAHLETHKENRERLFTCEHCGKKFYTNSILLSHVSRRHTDRRYICQVCSYPFTEKHNLAKHLLIHAGKKLYKCEICNKSYTTQASLVEHGRIHSGERPFICIYCPKTFLSKRRLDDHHKIHTGERPHKCDTCGQCFTQRGTLKRHMKVHDRTMPASPEIVI